jgi:signal transduction histidine kinase
VGALTDAGVIRKAPVFRLVVTSALLAAGLVATGAWVVTTSLTRAAERSARNELSRRLALVDERIERVGQTLTTTLDRLESTILDRGRREFDRLVVAGPDVVGEAAQMAAAHDIDLLSVIDEQGRVVSSARWPQLAGLEEPSLGGLAVRRAIVRRVQGPGGSQPAFVVAHRVSAGGHSLVLVAGRSIGPPFLDALAPGGVALLFDLQEHGSATAPAGGQALDETAPWRELALAGSAAEPRRIGEWIAAAHELRDDRGTVVATLVVGVSRNAISPWPPPVSLVVVLALAAALAAAVGGAAARRISRPVDRLVQAVDAIASGEADYTFPGRAEHELDRLAAAFSRLQRSLVRQQARSASAERVAAWREVARRVAHEVKNPLVPIRLTVENLERARRQDPRLFDELFDEGMRTILDEVEQLRRLVTEFSDFARLPAPRPRRVDLHELIDGVLELHAAEPGLQIVRSFRAADPLLAVDADQIAQALKNVVGNAIEAMRGGDAIPRLEIDTGTEGAMVEIRVRDNGAGIPPAAVGRVFEPYFTTKPEGTGLGMAMVYRIVIDHGGEVEAENGPDGGAMIRIRLPLATDRADGVRE